MYKALIRGLEDLTDRPHAEQIFWLAKVAKSHTGLWNDLEPDPLRRPHDRNPYN